MLASVRACCRCGSCGDMHVSVSRIQSRARASSPAIIFFDEIDGMVTARDDTGNSGVSVGDRVLSQLLQEMDGLQVCRW